MSNDSNSRKQLQLVTVITGVMVPIIIALAIMELYYVLGVAIVIELALIVWTVALVKLNNKQDHSTTKQ
ncbi:hypothetical protein GCM10007377_12890 [Galliscardovia ingluviei]|uniref:Uncharacterized protein n=1 Tax=Galliscardovia ingluviei TaxID=1769422 RepID=A0A8J3AHZ9_9BIFI|nr:hypothetical protein GCM10007377_12890 [Galliscardovia ingluviei]